MPFCGDHRPEQTGVVVLGILLPLGLLVEPTVDYAADCVDMVFNLAHSQCLAGLLTRLL